MRRLAVLALVVTAACSTGTPGRASSHSPRPTPTPVDAFTALAPPHTPGVGSVDAGVAQRAYDDAQGLLAQLLAEPGTLTGTGTSDLVAALTVPQEADLGVTKLVERPTAKGLGLRPLLAPGVRLASPPPEVVRSAYTADEVRGLNGEQAVRIGWDGAVRYHVAVAGSPHEVAYALKVAFVFGLVPREPGGIRLVQVVPGAFHAAPVNGACLAAGWLLPTAGIPTAADLGTGPWAPLGTAGVCPKP